MGQWQSKSKNIFLSNKWIEVASEQIETKNGFIIDEFYTIKQADSICVIAINSKGMYLINKVYRHGSMTENFEFPCGLIDDSELPMEAANRELFEETGYVAGEIFLVGTVYQNPANNSSKNYCYLAINCVKQSNPIENEEEIESYEFDKSKINELIESGEIIQSLHIASYYLTQIFKTQKNKI
jgi:ADP-ribose pyrophosphatase